MIRQASAPGLYALVLAGPLLALAACSDGLVVGEDATQSGTGIATTSSTGAPGTTAAPPSPTTGEAGPGGLTSSTGGTTPVPDPTGTTTLDVLTGTSTSTGDPSTGTTTGEPFDSVVDFDCVDDIAWVRHLAMTEWDGRPIYDLAALDDGSIIAVGHLTDTGDLGGGSITADDSDPFIVKYGPDGQHLWSRVFGGAGIQEARRVALDDQGNILVAGTYELHFDLGGGPLPSFQYTNVFLAKFTPDGDHVWSRGFGTENLEQPWGLASDSAGNVLLLAGSIGPLDFGAGPLGSDNATHVVKFDPTGALLWHRTFSASDDAFARGVAVGPDDDIVVVGEFDGLVDFSGWFEVGELDVYVVKLDASGDVVWFRQTDGTPALFRPIAVDVAVDDLGNIHLAGPFGGAFGFAEPVFSTGRNDAWVTTLLPNGEHLWSHSYGGDINTDQIPTAVATNGAGDTAIAGIFNGDFSLGGDVLIPQEFSAFAGRFAPDGSHSLSHAFGPGGVYTSAVEIGDDGSVWVTGPFEAPFEVGGVSFTPEAPHPRNVFLIRLFP